MFASSEYNRMLLWSGMSTIAFIYIRNSRTGPNTDPWGTPHLIFLVEEDSPLYRTNCLQSLRLDLSKSSILPLKPYL